MALENSGEIIVEVDCATAFEFARNPQQMAACIPGCRDLLELAPDRYSALLTSKVAYIALTFKVVVDVVKIDPLNLIEATVTGDAIKLAGRLVAKTRLTFAAAGQNRTVICYSVDVSLTGKLGGLGQPVFKAKSVELAREFSANLKSAIENAALPSSEVVARA